MQTRYSDSPLNLSRLKGLLEEQRHQNKYWNWDKLCISLSWSFDERGGLMKTTNLLNLGGAQAIEIAPGALVWLFNNSKGLGLPCVEWFRVTKASLPLRYKFWSLIFSENLCFSYAWKLVIEIWLLQNKQTQQLPLLWKPYLSF